MDCFKMTSNPNRPTKLHFHPSPLHHRPLPPLLPIRQTKLGTKEKKNHARNKPKRTTYRMESALGQRDIHLLFLRLWRSRLSLFVLVFLPRSSSRNASGLIRRWQRRSGVDGTAVAIRRLVVLLLVVLLVSRRKRCESRRMDARWGTLRDSAHWHRSGRVRSWGGSGRRRKSGGRNRRKRRRRS